RLENAVVRPRECVVGGCASREAVVREGRDLDPGSTRVLASPLDPGAIEGGRRRIAKGVPRQLDAVESERRRPPAAVELFGQKPELHASPPWVRCRRRRAQMKTGV